jgi:acyl-coenzyme A synthetase/AMP-(fatty) acid ligase
MQKVMPLPDINIEVPDKVNVAWEICDRRVQEGKGDRFFIYYEDRKITYRDLQKLQNKIGNALKKLGVSRGDCVVLRAPNSPELFACLLATLKIGATVVPTQTLFKEREVEHIINNSDAVAVISDPERVMTVEAVKSRCPTLKHIVVLGKAEGNQIAFDDLIRGESEELDCVDSTSEDTAFIFYTSGTTGVPKGVVRTHKEPYASGIPWSRTLAGVPDDIFMNPVEMGFTYFFGALAAVTFVGCQIVLYGGRVTPERVLEYIEKYRITKLATVPSLYRMILAIEDCEKKYDLSSLKFLVSAGEPLPPDACLQLKKRFGLETYDILGSSECYPICGERPSIPVKLGSMGKPFLGIHIAVVDDDGNFCPPNQIGHLVIKDGSPPLFVEYRKMPEKWAETHKYPGWFDTGDLAYVDEDGYFFHCGRSDDMIKSRGYLISPKELEETILEVPETFEAAVVGTPDPTITHRVKAFVTLKPGYSPSRELAEKIREYIKGRIAAYKVPKDIEFIEMLPRSPTGKMLRRELRDLEKERYTKGESAGFRFE